MARNTGNNHREGAVRERSQVYNPSTGHWIKRDANSGQFISVKSDGEPYKGIRKEPKTIIRSHPLVTKTLARKAEKAVFSAKKVK